MLKILAVLFVMYWLPTLIALIRRTPAAKGVAVVNFFLGWTIVGWVVALFMALASFPPPRERVTIYVDGRKTEAEIIR